MAAPRPPACSPCPKPVDIVPLPRLPPCTNKAPVANRCSHGRQHILCAGVGLETARARRSTAARPLDDHTEASHSVCKSKMCMFAGCNPTVCGGSSQKMLDGVRIQQIQNGRHTDIEQVQTSSTAAAAIWTIDPCWIPLPFQYKNQVPKSNLVSSLSGPKSLFRRLICHGFQ